MSFPFNLYLLGGLAAFACAVAFVPLARMWCHKTGLVDDPGHRKIHTAPTALGGGIAVLAAILIPLLLGVFILFFGNSLSFGQAQKNLLIYGFFERFQQVAIIVLGAAAMVWLGWLDDKHELRPGKKFLGQFLIAALVAAAGIRITLFVPNVIFSYVITIFWILMVTNAFNFMDNMNGLCAGTGFISSWSCAWAAALHGQYLVSGLAFAICGALLGFLFFNYPRASIFLGDAGSHLVGFLAAVLSILPHYYSKQSPSAWAVLSPLFFLAIPLLDLAWVVALRTKMRKPFYLGDTNHFSHQLVRTGLRKSAAVAILWLFSALFAAAAFLLFSR